MSRDQPDVISFGHVRTGGNRVALALIVLLSAALAIAIVAAVHYHRQVVALHHQAHGAPSPATTPTPASSTAIRSAGSIEVVNGNTLSFPVKGTAGAVVSVEYLRADRGPVTVWLSVAVSGLPLGLSYSASAGKCLRGRPVSLTALGALPDRRSGILLLTLSGFRVSTTESIWLDLKTARGALLGGIRGNFLVRQATNPIVTGREVCGHVQALLGHESFATTQRYAQLAPDAHGKVIESWSRRSGASLAHGTQNGRPVMAGLMASDLGGPAKT